VRVGGDDRNRRGCVRERDDDRRRDGRTATGDARRCSDAGGAEIRRMRHVRRGRGNKGMVMKGRADRDERGEQQQRYDFRSKHALPSEYSESLHVPVKFRLE
jgi:hypothetical protein